MYYDLQIGKSYNFTLYASGVLGTGFSNAKVLGIMDYDSAKNVQDITPLHIQALPNLPVGTPRNAQDLIYYKIRTTLNEVRVIASEWISSEPVMVTTQSIIVTISQVSSSDVPLIRDLLVINGYPNISIALA
jgi:hypothetical protein